MKINPYPGMNNILLNITKPINPSDSFETDNLKIYVSFAYNNIFVKIFNNLTFNNYETCIYETDINDIKFKINELYIFIHKALKKEDNHSFNCTISHNLMTIQLNAIFNQYFKLNYEIKLEKKEIKMEDIKNENNNKLDFNKLDNSKYKTDIVEIKKNYDELLIKYNSLTELINSYEIGFGFATYDVSIFNNLFVEINTDTLNINNIILPYKINPKQVTLYFGKIKKLLKLTKIITPKQIAIFLYDETTMTIIGNKLLEEYCNSKKIEVFLI